MKKITQTLLTIVAISIALLSFTQCKEAKDVAVTKLLEMQAEQMNKICPIQADQSLRIDSCKVSGSKTFQVFCTITAAYSAKTFNSDTFTKLTKPKLVYNIQTTDDLKQARELDVIFVYTYRDQSGTLMADITLTPEDYNQPIDENYKAGDVNPENDDIDALLEKSIAEVQPHLPVKINDMTTLTACKVLPNKTMEYVYTITKTEKELGKGYADKMRELVKENTKNTPAIKSLIDAGVTTNYVYNDKNGKELLTISLSSKDF